MWKSNAGERLESEQGEQTHAPRFGGEYNLSDV